MRIIIIILSLSFFNAMLCAAERSFQDHGVMAPVSEKRGVLTYQDENGRKWLFIVLRDTLPNQEQPRISLLAIDPEKGTGKQFFTGNPQQARGDCFTLMMSRKGVLYWWSGPYLNRLDVSTAEHQFEAIIGKDELGMAMAEGEDGRVFFTTYPRADLYRLQQDRRTAEHMVRLDEEEKYPIYLAAAEDGWLYAGLGTQRGKIVAYHDGEKKLEVLKQDREPRFRISTVIRESSGAIKARLGPGEPWNRLKEGALAEETAPPSETPYPPNSMYWNKEQLHYPDGARVADLDLSKRTFRWVGTDGKATLKSFTYESEGASITAIGAASDGNLYGSTSHPMQLWRFGSGKAENFGGIPLVGGGNLKGFVPWKHYLVANEYSRGRLFLFDPSQPFNPGATVDANPALLLTSHPHMSRPRAILTHSDGRHVISSGFPHYGRVAGRMVIYDLESRQPVAEVKDHDLAPGQSVIALAELPGGDVAFGTSIRTPGGAAPVAREAHIGIYQWRDRKTTELVAPVPGSEEIVALMVRGNRLLGVTVESVFFCYDLEEKKLIYQVSLSDAGRPANRSGGCNIMIPTAGGRLFLVMEKAIFEIDEKDRPRRLTTSPVQIFNAGVIHGKRLYFSSGPNLWSWELPKGSRKEQR